jgi:hypothetical protein
MWTRTGDGDYEDECRDNERDDTGTGTTDDEHGTTDATTKMTGRTDATMKMTGRTDATTKMTGRTDATMRMQTPQ